MGQMKGNKQRGRNRRTELRTEVIGMNRLHCAYRARATSRPVSPSTANMGAARQISPSGRRAAFVTQVMTLNCLATLGPTSPPTLSQVRIWPADNFALRLSGPAQRLVFHNPLRENVLIDCTAPRHTHRPRHGVSTPCWPAILAAHKAVRGSPIRHPAGF